MTSSPAQRCMVLCAAEVHVALTAVLQIALAYEDAERVCGIFCSVCGILVDASALDIRSRGPKGCTVARRGPVGAHVRIRSI